MTRSIGLEGLLIHKSPREDTRALEHSHHRLLCWTMLPNNNKIHLCYPNTWSICEKHSTAPQLGRRWHRSSMDTLWSCMRSTSTYQVWRKIAAMVVSNFQYLFADRKHGTLILHNSRSHLAATEPNVHIPVSVIWIPSYIYIFLHCRNFMGSFCIPCLQNIGVLRPANKPTTYLEWFATNAHEHRYLFQLL